MRKTNTARTPSSDFKVTTSEIPLLLQQAVTRKGILVPSTNLQLNLYPNTQLDLFCSDNFSFWCTVPNTWLTNYADPITRLQSPTREICWVQSSSVHPRWRSKRCLITKLYSAQTQQLLHKNNELGQILVWLFSSSTCFTRVPPLATCQLRASREILLSTHS